MKPGELRVAVHPKKWNPERGDGWSALSIGPPPHSVAPVQGLEDLKTVTTRNSLRSLKKRDKDCRVIRRKGRVYVINKKNPRFKARQG